MNVNRFLLILAVLHVVRYTSEWLYWHYCSKSFFMSLITTSSPVCQSLRTLSETSGVQSAGTISKALGLLASIQL